MKLSLKSLFPSSLFSKITLKAAILVALILFYLVIMFSSSREGLESKPMTDVQNMIDQVTNKDPTDVETESVESTESTDMAAPTKAPTKTPTTTPTVETTASPSKTPYATY